MCCFFNNNYERKRLNIHKLQLIYRLLYKNWERGRKSGNCSTTHNRSYASGVKRRLCKITKLYLLLEMWRNDNHTPTNTITFLPCLNARSCTNLFVHLLYSRDTCCSSYVTMTSVLVNTAMMQQ